MKIKYFKRITIFLSMFIITLFSLPNNVNAYYKIYESEADLKNELGTTLSFTEENQPNKTCQNGDCSKGTLNLLTPNGASFRYRLAIFSSVEQRTAWAYNVDDINTVIPSSLVFSLESRPEDGSSAVAYNACNAAVINEYNNAVGDIRTNLYYQNNSTFNYYYFAAQYVMNAKTNIKYAYEYLDQRIRQGKASSDIVISNYTYSSGEELKYSGKYFKACLDAFYSVYRENNFLRNITTDFGTNGVVNIASEVNKSSSVVKTDIGKLYGHESGNIKGHNYFWHNEYNDGSLFNITLKNDNGEKISLTKNTLKDYLIYINESNGYDTSSESRYDDFVVGVCYDKGSTDSECKKLISSNSNAKTLTAGNYEMEITIGGIIKTYRTPQYKASGSDISVYTNNIYTVYDEDKVTFKTTFTIPATSGGEETSNDGTINITYIDEDGKGIKGAIFKATSSTTTKSCTTNASGKCSITGLSMKTYKVTADSIPDGYETAKTNDRKTYYNVQLSTTNKTKTAAFTSVKIDDSGGEETTNDGIINITYVDEDGKGIKGAIFKISGTSNSCTTNVSGKCSITGLEVGKSYKVISYSRPSGYDVPTPSSNTVKLTTTSKTATLSFKSSKVDTTLGSITVEYLENNNNKILGGEFYLYKVGSSEVIGTCETNSQGICVFSNLELGEYKVVLNKVPENYEDSKQEKTVNLSKDNLKETVKFTGTILETKEPIVKIKVVNYNKVTEYIKGVKLVIKDSSGNTIKEFLSEEKEMVLNDITELGIYTIEIKEVSKGYEAKDTTYTFEVKESEETDVVIKLIPTTEVPDTLASISKLFIVLGIIGIIVGSYLIYTNIQKPKEENK